MNFKTWQESVETLETIQMNRNIIVDTYPLPNNIRVIEYSVMPTNPFKPSYAYCILDLVLEVNNVEVSKLLAKFNGIMNVDMYTSEGYFMPEFREIDNVIEPMERAFMFADEIKEFILTFQS